MTTHSELQLNQQTCFLPKNSLSLGEVTIYFFRVQLDPPHPSYVWHFHPASISF
jgi:hypothetical protein